MGLGPGGAGASGGQANDGGAGPGGMGAGGQGALGRGYGFDDPNYTSDTLGKYGNNMQRAARLFAKLSMIPGLPPHFAAVIAFGSIYGDGGVSPANPGNAGGVNAFTPKPVKHFGPYNAQANFGNIIGSMPDSKPANTYKLPHKAHQTLQDLGVNKLPPQVANVFKNTYRTGSQKGNGTGFSYGQTTPKPRMRGSEGGGI